MATVVVRSDASTTADRRMFSSMIVLDKAIQDMRRCRLVTEYPELKNVTKKTQPPTEKALSVMNPERRLLQT